MTVRQIIGGRWNRQSIRSLRIAVLSVGFIAAGIPLAAALGATDDPAVPAPLYSLDCAPGDRMVSLEVTWAPETELGSPTPEEAAKVFAEKELPSVPPSALESATPMESSASESTAAFTYQRGEELLAVITVEPFASGWLGTSYDSCYSFVPPVEKSTP